MLCDVVRRRRRRRCRRRWVHAPVIHAASHFYHEKRVAKRVAWVSISMHACDPVPIVMGLRLAALRAPDLLVVQNFHLNSLHRHFENTKKQPPVHAATLLTIYHRLVSPN